MRIDDHQRGNTFMFSFKIPELYVDIDALRDKTSPLLRFTNDPPQVG